VRIKTCPVRIKAAGPHEGTPDGVFEALVAVFGNIDLVGDKIVKGAFTDTLAAWEDSGDPIPVYWSHRMDDPDYCIGHVLEAKETSDGLWIKAQLDLDSPKAVSTYRLLKGRRVTQFSFAYDIDEAEQVDDKDGEPHTELRWLTLHEVGPTPIGANTETELLDVKSGGRLLQIAVTGATPADTGIIHAAIVHALDTPANPARPPSAVKAGRVLSTKNETTLRSALEKIAAGTADIETVLAALNNSDDGKATPTRPAAPTNPRPRWSRVTCQPHSAPPPYP
jgi:uncharacterized protein